MPRSESEKTAFLLQHVVTSKNEREAFQRIAEWIDGGNSRTLESSVIELKKADLESRKPDAWALGYRLSDVATLLYWRATEKENVKENKWYLSPESKSTLENLLPKKITDDPIRKTTGFIDTEAGILNKDLASLEGRKRFLQNKLEGKFKIHIGNAKDDVDLFNFLEYANIPEKEKSALKDVFRVNTALSKEVIVALQTQADERAAPTQKIPTPLVANSLFSRNDQSKNYGTFSEKKVEPTPALKK